MSSRCTAGRSRRLADSRPTGYGADYQDTGRTNTALPDLEPFRDWGNRAAVADRLNDIILKW